MLHGGVVAAHQLACFHQRQLHLELEQVHQALARFGDVAVAVLTLHLAQADLGVLSHLFGIVVKFTLLFGHWLVC